MTQSFLQPSQRDFMKHVFVFFTIILALFPEVYAEDDKWVDGIIYTYGQSHSGAYISYEGSTIMQTIDKFDDQEKRSTNIPLGIEFPETLMNPWSYRGAMLIITAINSNNNISPTFDGSLNSNTKLLRQKEEDRNNLKNRFFNNHDLEFINNNPNWAMTADVTNSNIYLGYFWGVFIPAFEYHRFLKFGIGYGISKRDFELKLNLCSEYKVTNNKTDADDINYKSECLGKIEIDSAKESGYRGSFLFETIFWERVTKQSKWRFFSMIGSLESPGESIKFENNHNGLDIKLFTTVVRYIEYVYRF